MSIKNKIGITAVGDGDTGKTALLIMYQQNQYRTDYIPTVAERYTKTISMNGRNYEVLFQDTAGQEDYDRLRPLSYPETDVFILCYAVNRRQSFDNIKNKWIPELRHFKPSAKVILVGTKVDLRNPSQKDHVSSNAGQQLKKSINAHAFVECSAKINFNIGEVIQIALQAATTQTNKRRKAKCNLL